MTSLFFYIVRLQRFIPLPVNMEPAENKQNTPKTHSLTSNGFEKVRGLHI